MADVTVEVHLFAAARSAVGESVVVVTPGTLRSVLDSVSARYPEFERVRPQCSFLVDEVASHDLEGAVGDGSRVDVLPPFAGG